MLLDYHIHPDYSIDACGTIAEHCAAAIRAGINEICFTPHYDIIPARRDIDGFVRCQGEYILTTEDWLGTYLNEIDAARAVYGEQGLTIRAGLEVDYHPSIEPELRWVIGAWPFDYILGAVHCLERYSIAIAPDCRAYYRGKTAREVCTAYYDLLAQAVDSGLFDSIAHLDLYKKFAAPDFGPEINDAHQGLLEPIFVRMAAQEMAVEINTKNWYKGLANPSPSQDLLELARARGVTRVTIGSDCHRPEDLGRGIARAVDLARATGFAAIYHYQQRQATVAIKLW